MTKTIDFKEKDREDFSIQTEILGLHDLDVVGKEVDDKNVLALYCASRWDAAVCPDCGEVSQSLHDYPKQRRIHDAPLRGQKVLLVFDSVRFDCEPCDKPFTQSIRTD